MMYLCTKIYHRATHYYQVIGRNIKKQLLLPETVCCSLHSCNSCTIIYITGLMLGQSLMVTGAIVMVLHVKKFLYYNVWHEVNSYCFHENKMR